MASGSRKNSATKTQASSSKASLKQTTLFRSFSSKNAPKVVPAEPQVLTQDPVTALAADATSMPPADESIMLSKPESLVVESSPVDAKTVVDNSLIDLTEAIDVDAGEDIPKQELLSERRSPSITIMDEDAITILPPPPVAPPGPARDEKSKKKNVKSKGSTRDEPIVIVSSSPIRVSFTSQDVNRPIHPFFMSKPKVDTPPVRQAHTRTSKPISTTQLAPFPNTESQHVRGPQTLIPRPDLPFTKRPSKKSEIQADVNQGYGFLKRQETNPEEPPTEFCVHRISDVPEKSQSNGIPEEYIKNHPAIARLVNDGSDNWPTSRRPWTEKWRPSCAQEVLGNEKSAIYLRNWLRALELQFEHNTEQNSTDVQQPKSLKGKSKQSNRGTKRSRIIRTIQKQRKKSRIDSEEEDDSWIVYSDESEPEADYEELDEFGEILSEVPASSQFSATRANPLFSNDAKEDDLGQLHNTILLSGPSGSGKTASIYACAEELGWDVFEVYPGVGRRNGSNIDNLIGEVGKNHLVLQKNTNVLKSFLSKKNDTQSNGEDNPSADNFQPAYSPRKKGTAKDTPEVESEAEQPNTRIKPIRQSLVLLEEVDILFKEDVNFWTTVIRIIKECKRPVICTCNDISLVPIYELPLQSIIHFVPCPVDVATSYLQALCLAEGYSTARDAVSKVYLHSGDASATPKPDLRRAINSLQVKCSTSPSRPFSESIGAERSSDTLKQEVDATNMVQKIEFLSYLDGNLKQNAVDYVVTEELSSYLPSENDELGHTILHDKHAKDRLEFGRHDRQGDMIWTAVSLSCSVEVKRDEGGDEMLERQRRVMREICPTAVWSRGNGSLWLEYMPYVRQMVLAEDKEEERGKRKDGRVTRNSGRSGYVRTIALTEEARRDVMFNIVDGA